MSDSLKRRFPQGTNRVTTGCQYCAVGCGYTAFLVPGETGEVEIDGVSRFITPSMTNRVRYRGQIHDVAVAPDARCDLNKGNHSVRGGSQGENLVTHDGRGRSTVDRLKSPLVRLADGRWHEIEWDALTEIMARLIVGTTEMTAVETDDARKINVAQPDALGVKLYEYQYLENTYAATKLLYGAVGTRNLAYHDRPSAAGSSPGMGDAGFRPHDFSYDDILSADVVFIIGANPYENQSVFFMQYCQGKEMIVMDPRRTATAQYAAQTGGLHLRPQWLGADSMVLYAMARSLIDAGVEPDLPIGNPDEIRPDPEDWGKRRRKSRVMDFEAFKSFLQDGGYTLDRAASLSGIPKADLEVAIARLAPKPDGSPRKVALLYEKGMIWGFNYHNTAAVASLGLLLGSYGRPGRLTGRVGGHQKGWAENNEPVEPFFGSVGRYPFRRGTAVRCDGDRYADQLLGDIADPGNQILVKHNLDNHVFGPTETRHENQNGLGPGEVRLRNNLITREHPDVRLLWIIGGNYLGQTNDGATKRARLLNRLEASGDSIARPATADPDTVVAALTDRMQRGGVVLVHQEIFANPTTEWCDIVIPAAGWGEDSFCRYNAQRRLKLYERFQDMPLHPTDATAIGAADPLPLIDQFRHSPKPDWAIFRDVARAIGRHVKDGSGRDFAAELQEAFPWAQSGEVADAMAEKSHRAAGLGLEVLLELAKQNGVETLRVHRVLGLGGDGDAQMLRNSDGQERYIAVSDEIAPDGSITEGPRDEQGRLTNSSPLYGNGVASNGVMVPVRLDGARLVGKLRTVREPEAGGYFFVKAPWEEIDWAYRRANRIDAGVPADDEVIVTNGRFNHLWNNMFHHLRNEYVNERYPEDMPGTILEVNPAWARARGIRNGQVVKVAGPAGHFHAVASLQDGVSEGGAFAMFSYPVRADSTFTFDGYPNNVTDGYADGINPIAALKYARARVTKVPDPASGAADWIYASATRRGPTFEQRNRIGPEPAKTAVGASIGAGARADWEMRELIVRKGLPRATVHTNDPDRPSSFLNPDSLLDTLPGTRFKLMIQLDAMHWFGSGGRVFDNWYSRDKRFALGWSPSVGGDDANPDENDAETEAPNGNGEGTEMAVKTSFRKHIRLMFSDMDRRHMGFLFDLSNYEDVKNASDDILRSLKGLEGHRIMPPIEDGGPWPEEWIALFERWISEGHPQ